MKKIVQCLILPAIALALASCAVAPAESTGLRSSTAASTATDTRQDGAIESTPAPNDSDVRQLSSPREEKRETVVLGSGVFVQGAGTGQPNGYADGDGVTLNFEQASLPEFMRVVFETILKENYLIDPSVSGSVTLHTTRPVKQDAVLPIVEAVLEQNGAALIRDKGIFKVIPLGDAAGASGSPAVGRYASSRRKGYGTQVVPLEHVSASEIEKILGPFVPEGSSLSVDKTRNVLILSGPKYRLNDLLATVRTFDVDWLKGMSFAMFRLDYADAVSVVAELETIIDSAGDSPLAGIVRVLPIERLNGILVITHRPDHIVAIQNLIEQFDWGLEGASGRRLYVYELENGKAENIAGVLQQIFGQKELEYATGNTLAVPDAASGVFRRAEAVSRPPPAPGQSSAASIGRTVPATSPLTPNGGETTDGIEAESQGDVTIIADQDNNAILVMATQQDYRAIESAIRRLDVAPRQVLIEATIAEVTLSDTLTYGVRWFIENSDNAVGFNAPVPSEASGEGLAFAFFDESSDLKAFFDVLATESSVKFLSTPQVMVLDNQTANIRVGDQIPVTTRSSQSTSNPDAPIVTEVQFRDTGTLLTVTPRINAGGQITMDISQEVSLPGTEPALGGGGNVSIAQRTINSSVIVQSGQTVVLGGLILETTSDGKSGIPVLMDIPLLGKLFSTKSEDVFRTELIITVSPRVIEDQREMQKVTEELRARMSKANRYEQAVKTSGSNP
ncbi:MAG: type II secretion system secretin GspD [Gammaproteobacteria bacterium]|nr:type II secretion system secretin GspD [Gammaproteobacteria bacterium]